MPNKDSLATTPTTMDWYQCTAAEVLDRLETSLQTGLSSAEVSRRGMQVGRNVLEEMAGRGSKEILWEQLRSALVALLVVAAGVSIFLEEYVDSAAILTIVALNTALGFIQDYRAEKALAALRQFDVPSASVLRDGSWQVISSQEIVPGDVVHLEAGNLVPADCRLLQVVDLRAQESTLTGESDAVDKSADPIDCDKLSPADQQNMAFKGTQLTYGHAEGVVTAIGMGTELGKIATSIQTVRHEATPLQRRLGQLGLVLALVALVIVAVVFAIGITSGENPRLMLLTALSLAVAIVPEGLPAVATVALAIGAMRMFESKALIRRLPAVETLGSVNTICTDKTGTLTKNQMTLSQLVVDGKRLELSNLPATRVDLDQRIEQNKAHGIAPPSKQEIELLLSIACLCNDAELQVDEGDSTFRAIGRPTEAALVTAAACLGFEKPKLLQHYPQLGEIPFESTRKRMTTVHAIDSKPCDSLQSIEPIRTARSVVFMKGGADSVLTTCQSVWTCNGIQPIDDAHRQSVSRLHDEIAARGIRVLGIAFRPLAYVPEEFVADELERETIFVGLAGMIDPPRTEVQQAVARCRTAGIRPIMITGDHPVTAQSIARQTGIDVAMDPITGSQLASMEESELRKRISEVSVFARVAPDDKLKIVNALQATGNVVAMTGDGVNDAPALKKAHIGVAMGITGADVSKEAADMVLLDDNFATIVNAVEQGRIVYDNIRKFVKYTMTSNAGEVCVMMLAPLLGMPLPLLPLQILWINLVTDGLPGLALAMEPPERTSMQRPPYGSHQPVIDRQMWFDIVWVGLLMGTVSIATGYWYWVADASVNNHWRTMVFTVLTLSQMGNVLAIRTSRDSLFRIGLFSNKLLLAAVLLTLALQLIVIYFEPLQAVFNTVPLSLFDLGMCLLLSTIVFWAIETKKFAARMVMRQAG
ncbi:MAG: cation-translocating P-type ATPase [Aeoliella sp.]